MKRILPFLIIIGALGAGLLLYWYWGRSVDRSRVAPQPTSSSRSLVGSVKLGADPPHVLGSTEAPAMLEEFGDFECQACAVLHPALKAMKAEFGLRLVIVFREFPLVSMHPHALSAARAA